MRICPEVIQELAMDLKRKMRKEGHVDLQIMQQSGWNEWEMIGDIH